MRLHRLEVTAFGPFAGTVAVDFDRLSEAGLFLLSGATGAGKTSVLDAVCFALYGDVPGDRSTAKRLRADQAEPDATPRVALETTLSSRRFRITRSPAWQRPKKRGSGTTTAQASVHVAERVGGEWVTLATRLDEAGLLVSGLVGMNLTQFTQVAMLPQGRFQTFLRAKSEDRHRLLHQLFRTGRFELVESWLRERRLTLGREVQAAHRDLADLVSRTSEAVAAPLPDGWDARDLTEPAVDGSLRTWAAGLAEDAQVWATGARVAAGRAAAEESAARVAHESGRVLATRRAVLDAARRERASLDATAEQVAAVRAEADAAGRAAGVVPVQRLVARVEAALTTADRVVADLDVTTDERPRVAADEQAALDAVATLRAALPRERALAGLVTRIAADEARGLALADERRRADAARTGAGRLAELSASSDEVEHHLEAALACSRLEARLAEARADHLDAREHAAVRRDELFEVHRARIEGMAAELAGAMAVGESCPVCGSADHPHKAVASPGAPDGQEERRVRHLLDDANLLEHAQASRVHDLTTQLGAARARAGDTPLDALREQLGAVRAEAAVLLAGLDGLDPDTDRLDALVTGLDRERAALDERLRLAHAEQAALAAELAELLDGSDAARLGDLVRSEEGRVRAARAALRAIDDLTSAREAHTEAVEALAGAADAAGFPDVGAALGAARTPGAVAALTQRVRDHDRRSDAVAAVLDADDAAEVAAAPEPDLPALEAAHTAALDTLTAATAAVERWSGRAERLEELGARLGAALDRWRPLHDDWQLTSELSAFCEGKATDNRLQMRLSAFVLAYRLSQVVAAANERLAKMSDQRYTLEHTGRAGAGETRGGLSLQVRDDWSGESRDPATLSGGETFVVSLALALGLADVITQEAGGADLDTLFVDEGFGSLDADTLDDVLDTLDGLRDGGRVVGVVSHVAEMRDRIPTRLMVTKARAGSTLSVTG